MLTAGPWMAFPPTLMFGLKAIGLPCSCRSIRLSSRAGQYRNATATSTSFAQHKTMLGAIWSHDERVLRPACLAWIDYTVLFSLLRSVEKINSLNITCNQHGASRSGIQAAIYRSLDSTAYGSFLRVLLLRRWRRWFPTSEARRRAVNNAVEAWNAM